MPYTDAMKYILVFSSNPYISTPSVQMNKETAETYVPLNANNSFQLFYLNIYFVLFVV